MTVNEKKEAFKEIALNRRSIRRYDETVDISREEMTEILELATSAPSSSNMQPWRFVVVNRPQIKEKNIPSSKFNADIVDTAAAVIAIFADLDSYQNADSIMQAKMRGMGKEEFFPRTSADNEIPEGKSPSEMVQSIYKSLTAEQRRSIVEFDCGLVTMQLMQAARVYGYDTCALGAYNKKKVSEILDMDDARYISVILLTIGKAMEEGKPTYRMPVSAVTKFLE